MSDQSTFPARFADAAARFSDRDAIIMPGSQTVTYRDLLRLAAAIQAGCPKIKGQRVLIACPDKVRFMVTVLAVQGLGGVAVPLDTLQPDAVAALAGDCEPALLLQDVDEGGDALVETAGRACPAISWLDLGSLQSTPANAEFRVDADPDDPCLMLYTSGTTGPRKGVLLTHSSFAAPSYSINGAMGYCGDEREYVCGDLTHAFALGRLRCLLPLGATAVVDNGKFMPQLALQGLAVGDCNAISGPASTVMILLQLFEDEFARFSESLLTIKMGSQSIPLEIKEKLMATFPAARIYQNYGLSEAQRLTLLEFHSERANLESTGKPVAGNAIRIVDETGVPLEPGEVGRIAVASPNLMTGYWRREALNAERMRDGFLITDNMGYLTPDGYLVFAGRADEVINVGGLKLTPEDIENAIRPALSDLPFAVCGMPDPEGLLVDVPAVVVETEPGGTAAWSEWPRRRISVLRAVRDLPVPKHAFCVDALPRTETGKVKRKVLTRWLTDKARA
jgi:acyl-CoA synthetase (AMP-forming)/AMP-acid ligase II